MEKLVSQVVTWPAATRVSFPNDKGGRGERPWERGCGTTKPYAYVNWFSVVRSFPVWCYSCDSPDMLLVVLPIEGPPRKWHPCEWNFCNLKHQSFWVLSSEYKYAQTMFCFLPFLSPNSAFFSLSLAAFRDYCNNSCSAQWQPFTRHLKIARQFSFNKSWMCSVKSFNKSQLCHSTSYNTL